MSAPTITPPAGSPAVPDVPVSPYLSPSPASPSASATQAIPLGGHTGSPDGVPRELLVALRDPADLSRSLVSAAARARAAHRPLSVVIVEPARPWTIDAAVIALQDRRRAREIASMTAAARTMCARVGVELHEVIVLRPGWAWTRAGRNRAVDTRLRAIARSRDAELHGAEPSFLVAHDITGEPYPVRSHRTASHRSRGVIPGRLVAGDVMAGAR